MIPEDLISENRLIRRTLEAYWECQRRDAHSLPALAREARHTRRLLALTLQTARRTIGAKH